MAESTSTLDIIREAILGDEVRHRIVRRKRDGTYWYVREHRSTEESNKWIPCAVDNQSGRFSDACARFEIFTN